MASVSRLLARSRPGQLPRFSCPSLRRFSNDVSHPSNRVQIYISRSRDPCLNLSIEHYLLQRSPPDSVVLLLYTNRPCVVVGRNQNPWLEVNLGLLGRPGRLASSSSSSPGEDATDDDNAGGVQLVRRRSGGGTVFHDEGNVNYSVICPPSAFDRNKHAEMVVRALRGLGVATAQVNARHDIVVDDADSGSGPGGDTFKVSGSAYRLTRTRSLHHGTCLLSSPNLSRIGQFLQSPAAAYIKARGVESVRSRIANVDVGNRAFEDAVVAEFGEMYGNVDAEIIAGDEAKGVSEIVKGYEELMSDEWTYLQTPLFTFSTYPTDEDPRERPPLPDGFLGNLDVLIQSRHGEIVFSKIAGLSPPDSLENVRLDRIRDWRNYVEGPRGEWLNKMFGVRTD